MNARKKSAVFLENDRNLKKIFVDFYRKTPEKKYFSVGHTCPIVISLFSLGVEEKVSINKILNLNSVRKYLTSLSVKSTLTSSHSSLAESVSRRYGILSPFLPFFVRILLHSFSTSRICTERPLDDVTDFSVVLNA